MLYHQIDTRCFPNPSQLQYRRERRRLHSFDVSLYPYILLILDFWPAFDKDRINIGFLNQLLPRIAIPVRLQVQWRESIWRFLYSRRYFSKRGPEARLYSACFAAVLMPISMFIYAWCSFTFVHWIALTIAIVLYIWATFIIYLAVFSYVADWWES